MFFATTIAAMIERHFERLLSHFVHRLTNAFCEGLNDWHQNVPESQRSFVKKIAAIFSVKE